MIIIMPHLRDCMRQSSKMHVFDHPKYDLQYVYAGQIKVSICRSVEYAVT